MSRTYWRTGSMLLDFHRATRRSSRVASKRPTQLRDARGCAEHERLRGDAEAQVLGHRTQGAVDVRLDGGARGGVELRIHERSHELSLEPEHGSGA